MNALRFALGATLAFAAAATAADGPYCGVYCAFAALKQHGSAVELHQLLDPRYVSSDAGSQLDDLCRAIRDHGGRAVPMSGLGATALRASPDPVILHVRRPGYRSEYAHWVLYLGGGATTAHVLDPPGDAQDIPYAELLAVWDGRGIVVESHLASGWQVYAGGRLVPAAAAALLVAVLAVVHRLSRRPRFGVLAMAGASGVVALVLHGGLDTGFLRSPSAAGEVARRYFDSDPPSVSADALAGLIGRPDLTLVDCRMESTFRHGHLPGAVNLPVHANTAERVNFLAGVPPGNRVVVYCQSDKCDWSRQIAGDLYHRGYRNVAIYPTGWIGWTQRERDRHAPRD